MVLSLLFSCKKKTESLEKIINKNWQFSMAEENDWLPATVPGCVHTDLLNNGKIEDPFYRLNEHDLQWIDKLDWEYKTTFNVNPEFIEKDIIELNFKGLDTYAEVFLNDSLVLSTNNMFREWKVKCKELIKTDENNLRILFKSAIKIGVEKHDALDYIIPTSNNDLSELGGLGDKRVSIFSRKPGYHFGWDWGPRFVTSGIWKPLILKAWNDADIRDLNIKQKELNKDKANLLANIEVESVESSQLIVELSIDGKKVKTENISINEGLNNLSIPFEIKSPKLWWPNGLGDQNLYTVEIKLLKDNAILSQKSSRIGLRTIEVVQEPDSIGKSFYFKVNGHPVFMKGANYIPQDIFVDRVTPDHYEKLIQSAIDANMNMIRVWGGGIYEKDIFYELCDEKGLLVWQDFMFACSMYPVDNEFLENVRQEAIDNVKRLRNHPCIALWCGNNECLSGWKRWGWKDWVIKKQGHEVADIIWHGYDTLFHKIIPSVINELDNDRLYWCSSPASGFNESDNWNSGDTHYWGVWWGKEPFNTYTERIGRFMSEYGFQSFPEFSTVRKYSIEEDWDIYSPVMKSHQRSTIGNETIAEYMDRDYRKPKNFEMFLYVNHVLQAEGIKTAIEAQRRSMPYCMGSLYWQIDDCWPVASWSSIDYYGKWKALHYFAKKAFENVLVSPVIENEKIKIFVVSDKLEDLQAKLKLTVIDFEGNVINTLEKEINIKQNSSNIYLEEEITKIMKNVKQENSLILVAVFNNANQLLSDNILYFKSPKDLELPKPSITLKIDSLKNGFTIKLITDELAKNVYLTIPNIEGFFTDNYFDLLPGYEKVIEFRCDKELTTDELKESLNIVTLVDSY